MLLEQGVFKETDEFEMFLDELKFHLLNPILNSVCQAC